MAPENEGNPPPESPDVTVVEGAVGGSGDGGGGSSSDPVDKRQPYRSMLLGMRINPGPFARLISQAAAEGWSREEFLWALEDEKAFQRRFPGISALLKQGQSVVQAVGEWRQMYAGFKDELRDQGLLKYARLSPKRFGMYLEAGQDVEEMLFRVSIIKMAKTSESFRLAFNQILKNKGDRQLDKEGWARFLAGKGDSKLYDMYEGALLLQQLRDEGLRIKDARRLAKMVAGEDGPAFSASGFAKAMAELRDNFPRLDLAGYGYSAADLALVALQGTLTSPEAVERANQLTDHLEQLGKNQAATEKAGDLTATSSIAGRPTSGAAPQTGSTGLS